jgi:hypothetical protein
MGVKDVSVNNSAVNRIRRPYIRVVAALTLLFSLTALLTVTVTQAKAEQIIPRFIS